VITGSKDKPFKANFGGDDIAAHVKPPMFVLEQADAYEPKEESKEEEVDTDEELARKVSELTPDSPMQDSQ
jgi:hypothetical protein